MPILPIIVPARPTVSGGGDATKPDAGALLIGRVARIDPDGNARINFPGLQARAQAGKQFQTGQRIFAQVQKTRNDILLSIIPDATDGEVLGGTASRRAGANLFARLTRLGDSEMNVRPAPNENPPQPGAPLRAQIQARADKAILQMLPARISGGVSGNVSDATVTMTRADGTVMIEVDGTTLIANSTESVSAGEQVRVRLTLVGDKWLLQLVPKGSAANLPVGMTGETQTLAEALTAPRVTDLLASLASGELKIGSDGQALFALLLQNIPTGAEQGTWLAGLMRALELVLLSPHKAELAEQLATAMENSGVFFESRLLRAAASGAGDAAISGDLKLALLLAAQKSADASRQAAPQGAQTGAQLGEIAGKVGRLLDTVTAEQFQNLRLLPTNEIYVQLPFASESGLESVEIHISPEGRQTSKKIDPQNIALMLAVSTSNLGRVKASLSIAEGKVSCRLKAERDSVVKLLAANADALKGGLEKLNYEVIYIDCALSESGEDMTIITGLAPAARGGIDEGLDVQA
jgi:hypothetical protein